MRVLYDLHSFPTRRSSDLLNLSLVASGFAQDKNHKKKNSDVQNIGIRDINKGSINFVSLEKEIALGRELARQAEQEVRSEEHTSELQSLRHLVCRLLLDKK